MSCEECFNLERPANVPCPECGDIWNMNNINASDMKVGDAVEFMSDRQAEKGPSCGRVIDRDGPLVKIRHSDHPGEVFNVNDLIVNKLTTHIKGGILWMLK